MNNDSLTAIADSLDQLADEVEGNESRPAADDICARILQATKRIRAVDAITVVESDGKVTHAAIPAGEIEAAKSKTVRASKKR